MVTLMPAPLPHEEVFVVDPQVESEGVNGRPVHEVVEDDALVIVGRVHLHADQLTQLVVLFELVFRAQHCVIT